MDNAGFVKVKEDFKVVHEEKKTEEERVYSYDEAIDLAGVGAYTRGLLVTLSLSLLSITVDMFGFSIIVTGCACDFDLDHSQRSVLISVPFIGPIVMSYFWGYFSDTQGRRRSLLVGLSGVFVASTASAFSTHWYMLAVLKIIGTSFSSSVQSVAYSFLEESSPLQVKSFYMLIMTSVLMLFMVSYSVPGYFILNMQFSYNWGLISFTPWRLLVLVLAAPLGVSVLMMHCFCESPKFLLNAGKEAEALECLKTVWRRNGNSGVYPVTKVVLNEEATIKSKDGTLLDSMLEQILPLFKPPLLWKTLQLLYLTAVIYAINNSLVMWMPLIVEAFTAGLDSTAGLNSGSLCDIIAHSRNITGAGDMIICTSNIDKRTLFSGIIHGVMFSTITLSISKLGHRKKVLMIMFFLIPLLSALGAVYNENEVASLVFFVGMMMTNMCMGVLFAYYVDLYQTSYRGMAACLGVMMSRLSGLAGVHFVGALVLHHCTATFYAFAVYLLSGVFVAYFLPPDRLKKK